MTGLRQVLKIGWNIVNSDASTAANRLQALALINDSYKYLMDLTTDGVVITDAIKYVQGQIDRLNKTEKELLQNIKQQKDKGKLEQAADSLSEVEDSKTTNGVF